MSNFEDSERQRAGSGPDKGSDALRIVSCVLAGILLMGTGVFVWGADRGFDLTDEGVYLLDYENPGTFGAGFTSYQRVGAILYGAVGGDIARLRVAGFLLLGLATFFFAERLAGWIKEFDPGLFASKCGRRVLVLGVMSSVLPAYCWPPPTPSYNTFAGTGLLVGAGALLAAMGGSEGLRGWAVRFLWVAVFGCSVVFLLLVKGSAGVGLGLAGFGMLMLWPLCSTRRKIGTLVMMGGLTVAVAGVAFFLVPGLAGAWTFLVVSVQTLAVGGGASGIIARHAGELVDFGFRLLKSYYAPVLVALAGVLSVRFAVGRVSPEGRGRMSIAVTILAIAAVAIAALVKEGWLAGIHYRNGSLLPYLALGAVCAVLAGGLPASEKHSGPAGIAGWVVLIAWLFALPFVGAAGTTHRIYVNGLLHLAPMFGGILLLAEAADRRLPCRTALPVAGVLTGVLALSQFLSGFFVEPYRLSTWKPGQTVAVPIGSHGSKIKVDPANAAFLERTRGLLVSSGFRPGDDVLGIFDLPGVVFATGGVSPGRPWYFSGYGAAGDTENVRALEGAGAMRVGRAFILATAGDEKVGSYLGALGIRFPEAYRAAGEVRHPVSGVPVRVWAPAGPPQNE